MLFSWAINKDGCRWVAMRADRFHWALDKSLAYLQLLYLSELSAVPAVTQAYNYNIFEKAHLRNK